MGAKGAASINITNQSAVYMVLVKTMSEIQSEVSIVRGESKAITDTINDCEVDRATKESLEETLGSLGSMMTTLEGQISGINQSLNKIISVANEIAKRSQAQQSTVTGAIKEKGSALRGRR